MESDDTGELESGPAPAESFAGTVGRGLVVAGGADTGAGGAGVGVGVGTGAGGVGSCATAELRGAQAAQEAAKIGVRERKGIGTVRFQTALPSIGFENRRNYRFEDPDTGARAVATLDSIMAYQRRCCSQSEEIVSVSLSWLCELW